MNQTKTKTKTKKRHKSKSVNLLLKQITSDTDTDTVQCLTAHTPTKQPKSNLKQIKLNQIKTEKS